MQFEEIEKLMENDLEKASEIAKEKIKEDPSNPNYYYLYGKILYKKELYEAAAVLFEIANLMEENVEYLFMAFLSYLMLGRVEQAKYAINQAMLTDKKKTLELLNRFILESYDLDKKLNEEEKRLLKVKVKLFAENFD